MSAHSVVLPEKWDFWLPPLTIKAQNTDIKRKFRGNPIEQSRQIWVSWGCSNPSYIGGGPHCQQQSPFFAPANLSPNRLLMPILPRFRYTELKLYFSSQTATAADNGGSYRFGGQGWQSGIVHESNGYIDYIFHTFSGEYCEEPASLVIKVMSIYVTLRKLWYLCSRAAIRNYFDVFCSPIVFGVLVLSMRSRSWTLRRHCCCCCS